MKRVLVLGGSSFIGANLCAELRKGYVVYGTFHRNKVKVEGVPFLPLSLSSLEGVEGFVRRMSPKVIVNCISERDEAICAKNPDYAKFINAFLPGVIGGMASSLGFRFIQLSTSKVFSGDEGLYTEEDPVAPRSVYGVTKREGDDLLKIRENVFVLRLGTVFGFGPRGGQVLPDALKSFLSKKGKAYISDEWRSFVSVKDVVRAIKILIEAPEETEGLYHFGGAEKDTYYSFMNAVCEVFSFPSNLVSPIEGSELKSFGWDSANRGKDLSLDPSLFAKVFHTPPKALRQMLDDVRKNLVIGNF